MAQHWGESFGGPPGVPVTRHGNGPQVRLKYDPTCTGRLLREGPSQSIVRWRNGNEDCVCNSWIERAEETSGSKSEQYEARLSKPEGTAADAGPSASPIIQTLKPRKEPDALARRVSEFDDAELKVFALKNGCWDDAYATLPNNGLRRMGVMNKLRAKLRREPEYEITWT